VARHARCPVLVCKGAPRAIRSMTVAVDGSDHARAALRFVRDLPLPAGTALHLVAVVEPLRYPSTAPGMIAPQLVAALREYEDERRRELEQVLAAAAAEVPSPVTTSTTTLVGAPALSILAEAEKRGSDLVVVGARGLGAVKRLLLGSVSESVLRHAACPVLVVRPRAADGG
jgi:nucleotide-binding universal stress UspA family protein